MYIPLWIKGICQYRDSEHKSSPETLVQRHFIGHGGEEEVVVRRKGSSGSRWTDV